MKYEFTTDIAAEGMRIDACIRIGVLFGDKA